jgi:predicted phosphohydrolase
MKNKMTLQYCSDLHLEFSENRDFLEENPLQPKGNILLLAGDIVPFAIMEKCNYFFDLVSDIFDFVYWLPGNHEYYHADASQRSGTLCETIRRNVFLVNNVSVEHNDVKFIFSTMWSRISPVNEASILSALNDFKLIDFNGAPFSPADFNRLHIDSLTFLREEIASQFAGKKVVATHHVPTFLHYPAKYKGDRLNEVFAVELFEFIEDSGPDYWIYGHHHNNTPDFSIGHTLLLTNQVGYVRYNEHLLFKTGKAITL